MYSSRIWFLNVYSKMKIFGILLLTDTQGTKIKNMFQFSALDKKKASK